MMDHEDHRRMVVGFLLLGLAIVTLCCQSCRPYEAAWRTTAGVRAAAEATDKAMTEVVAEKHRACTAAHGQHNPAYRACIKGHREAMEKWILYARPAINSALALTVASLQIAERVKAKALDWIGLLRPAICALGRCMRAFGHLLPPATQSTVMLTADLVSLSTCDATW